MQKTAARLSGFALRLQNAEASLSDQSFIALALLLFTLLSAPLFLRWPPPMADEEMFGDVARSFGEHFRLASPLVAGQEHGMYWQPPVYFLLLAPIIKTFGWSLAVLRGFSFSIGILVVALTYLVARSFASQSAARVGTLLLVFNPHFLTYIRYGRMDGLCVLFILGSVLLAWRAIQHRGARRLVFPGLVAGAAILTHPLGVIAPFTILLWLVIVHRREKIDLLMSVVWFSLPIIAAMAFWLVFLWQDPHAFLVQMQYQLARKDRGWLVSSMGFFQRYRFLPLVLALGIIGVAAAWDIWRRSRENVGLLLLVVANLVTFGVITTRFELPYYVYWAPLASLAAGVAVTQSSSRWRNALRIIALAAVLNGVAYLAYVTYSIHWKERTAPGYYELARSVAAMLPASCLVMSAGYPSLYWGLREERPDVRYIERVYFDSTLAKDVVSRLDYYILTRSFAPEEDAQLLSRDIQTIGSLAAGVRKKLVFVGEVGEQRRFVASAKIYKLVPSSDTTVNSP